MPVVEIKGLDRLKRHLETLGKDVGKIVDDSLHKSAYQIQRQAVKNIQDMNVSYNGRIYDAKETGALMRSITVERAAMCQWVVGTGIKYAPAVEFGTGSAGDAVVPHTTRAKWTYFDPAKGVFRTAYPTPPRPFLRPAFDKDAQKRVVEALARDMMREARGGM